MAERTGESSGLAAQERHRKRIEAEIKRRLAEEARLKAEADARAAAESDARADAFSRSQAPISMPFLQEQPPAQPLAQGAMPGQPAASLPDMNVTAPRSGVFLQGGDYFQMDAQERKEASESARAMSDKRFSNFERDLQGLYRLTGPTPQGLSQEGHAQRLAQNDKLLAGSAATGRQVYDATGRNYGQLNIPDIEAQRRYNLQVNDARRLGMSMDEYAPKRAAFDKKNAEALSRKFAAAATSPGDQGRKEAEYITKAFDKKPLSKAAYEKAVARLEQAPDTNAARMQQLQESKAQKSANTGGKEDRIRREMRIREQVADEANKPKAMTKGERATQDAREQINANLYKETLDAVSKRWEAEQKDAAPLIEVRKEVEALISGAAQKPKSNGKADKAEQHAKDWLAGKLREDGAKLGGIVEQIADKKLESKAKGETLSTLDAVLAIIAEQDSSLDK